MKKRTAITKAKPRVELGITTFDNLIALAFSSYSNKPFFKKVYKFFELVDTNLYKEDVDIEPRFIILEAYLNVLIEENVSNEEMILDYIMENTKDVDDTERDNILEDAMSKEFTLSEATSIENNMIDRINFYSTEPDLHKLDVLLNEWKKGNFSSYNEIITNIQKVTSAFSKKVYARSQSSTIIDYLDFSENNFKEKMNNIHREITNEKRLVKSGLQRLNKAISGGFAPGRVYLFLGMTGG
jgi:hypothetical protein